MSHVLEGHHHRRSISCLDPSELTTTLPKRVSTSWGSISSILSVRLDWESIVVLILLPAYGIFQSFQTHLQTATAVWSLALCLWTGISITAGYHRLWAHTSYSATLPLRIFLALGGAAASQRSIRWWARGHRAHHRFTDTEKDPYSIHKGLWHSHIGWMLVKPDLKYAARVKVQDLDCDPVVMWQHKYYTILLLCFGIGLPTAVAGICWGDWWGGLIYAFILRMFVIHQVTFCVNSVAHTLGEQPYDSTSSPRDHLLTALLTLGEGYHNFHHRFPCDYRNGVKWYHYDPTKWFIRGCKALGLAYDLKAFPTQVIRDSRMETFTGPTLKRKQSGSAHEISIQALPVVTWDEFTRAANYNERRLLVVISGVIHDVTNFAKSHPGGSFILEAEQGTDVTTLFNGGVYNHSKAARKILASMRVAVLRQDENH
ncbi:hypothetical protein PV10_01204 [Exophiala mesophila]|uniref:Acyl-CoA desaturase n=1 Tax=Exophiala mesophila TaxID=212818 RepID=A0A0D2AEW8_EXOME|nr:uncharacterized protein PV10_01204 [Exophiala mesophila]KIV97453.1 hypothetical protein PV10_01204 [Exophiala mesophila]